MWLRPALNHPILQITCASAVATGAPVVVFFHTGTGSDSEHADEVDLLFSFLQGALDKDGECKRTISYVRFEPSCPNVQLIINHQIKSRRQQSLSRLQPIQTPSG